MKDADNQLAKSHGRRAFLAKLAAAGAALPMAGFAEPAGRAAPFGGAEARRTVNIFSKHLQFLDYEATAQAAVEIGADGVDLTVRPNGHVLPERVERDLPRAVGAIREAGLDVYTITTAIKDAREPYTEPILRTASELGIGYYRLGSLPYDENQGVAGTLEAYRPQFGTLAEMNARYGIHGAYQNHAGTRVGGPVWDVWMLVHDRDPRWVGCQYDIRHATVEGGRSWPLGMELLSSHIVTTVVKDFEWAHDGEGWYVKNVPLGEGMVDFDAYFERVKQYGISGPVSVHIEYDLDRLEALEGRARRTETIAVMRRDVQRLRSMLGKAGL